MDAAAIFDMDGTLCNVSSIRYHVNPRDPRFSGKKRFDLFHAGSIDCPPNDFVVAMARMFHEVVGYKVLIVTARKEEWRYHTILWLHENNIAYDYLYMRKDGDNRKDYDVKEDILNEIERKYRVHVAYDDNPNVIALWQRRGIKTVLVPGWED
jgi:hypothetical protein